MKLDLTRVSTSYFPFVLQHPNYELRIDIGVARLPRRLQVLPVIKPFLERGGTERVPDVLRQVVDSLAVLLCIVAACVVRLTCSLGIPPGAPKVEITYSG